LNAVPLGRGAWGRSPAARKLNAVPRLFCNAWPVRRITDETASAVVRGPQGARHEPVQGCSYLCQYEKVRGISALPIDLSTTIARLGGGGVPSERVIENFKKDTRPGQNVSMGSLDRAGDADNTSQLCVLAEQLLFTDTAAPAIRRCRLLGLSKLCCGKSWEGEREAERPARLSGLSCGHMPAGCPALAAQPVARRNAHLASAARRARSTADDAQLGSAFARMDSWPSSRSA